MGTKGVGGVGVRGVGQEVRTKSGSSQDVGSLCLLIGGHEAFTTSCLMRHLERPDRPFINTPPSFMPGLRHQLYIKWSPG